MELQGIIRAQTDIETGFEKIGKRIALVSQEQCIVAQWAHRDTDLLEVK
jgi:hypothetical protein